MNVDRILDCPEYNLRSVSRLSARDDVFARVWLDGLDPLYAIYFRLRNRRLARRKEFYEAAFLLDRLVPELRRTRVLYEMAAGHGMFGMFAAILHRNIRRVVHVDPKRPLSYERIRELAALDYPFVKSRCRYVDSRVGPDLEVPPSALVVGLHCCGSLTDHVVDCAIAARGPFAVVPCCERRGLLPQEHRAAKGDDIARILNDLRLERWRRQGYEIDVRELPLEVTLCRRIFVGAPKAPIRTWSSESRW